MRFISERIGIAVCSAIVASVSIPLRAAIGAPDPSTQPFDLDAIEGPEDRPPDCGPDCPFFTDVEISQQHLAEPSLWWSIEQIGTRLVPDWIVYPSEARVDLAIDPQRWNWMDYFERYTLVTQLSHVLRPREYDFRLFDPQEPERPVASYTCNFEIAPPDCQLRLSTDR